MALVGLFSRLLLDTFFFSTLENPFWPRLAVASSSQSQLNFSPPLSRDPRDLCVRQKKTRDNDKVVPLADSNRKWREPR